MKGERIIPEQFTDILQVLNQAPSVAQGLIERLRHVEKEAPSLRDKGNNLAGRCKEEFSKRRILLFLEKNLENPLANG